MQLTPSDLQRMRLEKGMTQAQLAAEVDVSQSYIARMERRSLDPKLSIANRIVAALTKSDDTICAEIMTADPQTIDARDSADEAVEIMQRGGFSQIPVLRGTRIVGLVTERDIIRNLQHDMKALSVQAVMSPGSVPAVDPSTPADVAASLLQTYQAILVQNQGRLEGIVTRSDVMRLSGKRQKHS